MRARLTPWVIGREALYYFLMSAIGLIMVLPLSLIHI